MALHIARTTGVEPLLIALVEGKAGIKSLSIERPGLHDAFVAIAGEAVAAEDGRTGSVAGDSCYERNNPRRLRHRPPRFHRDHLFEGLHLLPARAFVSGAGRCCRRQPWRTDCARGVATGGWPRDVAGRFAQDAGRARYTRSEYGRELFYRDESCRRSRESDRSQEPAGLSQEERGQSERRRDRTSGSKPVITGTKRAVERESADIELLAAHALNPGLVKLPEATPDIVAETANNDKQLRTVTAQGGQILVFFLTMLLAGMVLSNLVEEKSNKIIEILAASIPMESVFLGKLFAMLGMALLGIFVWTSLGLVGLAIFERGTADLSPPRRSAGRCS